MTDGTAYGPDPVGVRRPSLGRRVAGGVLILVPTLAITAGVPAYALAVLGSHGVASSVSVLQTTIGGLLLSILSAMAYIARPGRGYGPAVMARAAAAMGYFLTLANLATATVPIGGGTYATVDYSGVLRLLALVPTLSLVGGALVTYSDRRNLPARLRREFPA
jgi:hypothetical protein